MKTAYRVLEEHPSHFLVHDGEKRFPVAKGPLSDDMLAKIRGFQSGGETEEPDDIVLPLASIEPAEPAPTGDFGSTEAEAAVQASQVDPTAPGPGDLRTMFGGLPPGDIRVAAEGSMRAPPSDFVQPSPEEARAYRDSVLSGQQAAPPPPPEAPAPAPSAPAADPFGGRGPLRQEFLNPRPVAPAAPQIPGLPQMPRAPSVGGYRPSAMATGVSEEITAASNAQQEALRSQAAFQAQQFEMMQKLQAQQNAALQANQQAFQQRIGLWQQRSNQLFEEARDARVDPGHYWNDKSDLAKVGSVISIILSGIGQGMQNAHGGNAPNLALAVLDKAIDHDIESQKFNINKMNTLIGQHLQMGNSMIQAEQLARADLKDLFAGQMLEAAYKYGGPEAIASAEAQAAALRGTAAKTRAEVAAMDVTIQERSAQIEHIRKQMQVLDVQITAYNQAIQADNAKKTALMQALASGQPVSQRDLYRAMGVPDAQIVDIPGAPGQSRIVPGSKEDQKTVREAAATHMKATAAIDQLLAIGQGKSSLNPVARGEALVWSNSLIGMLRLMLTGPGAFSEGERKLIGEIVANPTNVWSIGAVNRAKLNTLKKVLQGHWVSILGAYTTTPGLTPPGSELRPLTPQYANED